MCASLCRLVELHPLAGQPRLSAVHTHIRILRCAFSHRNWCAARSAIDEHAHGPLVGRAPCIVDVHCDARDEGGLAQV